MILVEIGLTIEVIVQCRPIHYFFTRAYARVGITNPDSVKDKDKDSCLRQNLHVAIPLAAGLANDIAILLLPVAGLWNLQMTRVKKFSAYFALFLGKFACAIEIVRNFLFSLCEE